MAAAQETLDSATAALLLMLSQTPTQQLAILITQHANLPKHTTRALRLLSKQAIVCGKPLSGEDRKHADRIANVLRRLIARGDPSQARRLLPTQAAIIDLAVCVDAQDILARLMDRISVEESLKAVANLVNKMDKADTLEMRHLSFLLARVASSLPVYQTHQPGSLQRKTDPKQGGVLDVDGVIKIFRSLTQAYTSLAPSRDDLDILTCKVCILDAAWAVLTRYVRVDSAVRSSDVERIVSSIVFKESTKHIPLVDLTLIEDLSIAKPIIPLLRQFAPKSRPLDELERRFRRILSDDAKEYRLDTFGQAWETILASATTSVPFASPERGPELDADLEASILAILPYWQTNVEELRRKLKQPPYTGQSNDTIVQLLMDEGEPKAKADGISEGTQIVSDPMELLRQRANVFDDTAPGQRLARVKGKERAAETGFADAGLSDDLKASILMRAEAPDSDDEERQEWDPFADAGGREIGFEEELTEESGPFEPSRTSTRRADGNEGESDDESYEEGEADGRYGASRHGQTGSMNLPPSGSQSGTAAERAKERILITAWKENGKDLFGREARKTKARLSLLASLNNLDGQSWDDQLVESWGTMFDRNPRKEKLLAAADDILRFGNPNRLPGKIDGEEEQRSPRSFGADRGRGGRILTGTHGGGGRGGGRGRGRGSRGQQRGKGQRGSGGAHSGRG